MPDTRNQELDPELLALKAPPQTQRVITLTIMAAAVVAAMAMVLALRLDLAYSLASNQVADLGDVQSLSPSELTGNTYVRLSGIPSIASSVGFSKIRGERYRVFPLAGQRTIYVQVRDDGGENFVRTEFKGRLVTFGELGGRYAGVAEVMRAEGLPVSSDSFLLLADEAPRNYAWTWLIAVLCVSFVILDAFFIVRWFRPVKLSK